MLKRVLLVIGDDALYLPGPQNAVISALSSKSWDVETATELLLSNWSRDCVWGPPSPWHQLLRGPHPAAATTTGPSLSPRFFSWPQSHQRHCCRLSPLPVCPPPTCPLRPVLSATTCCVHNPPGFSAIRLFSTGFSQVPRVGPREAWWVTPRLLPSAPIWIFWQNTFWDRGWTIRTALEFLFYLFAVFFLCKDTVFFNPHCWVFKRCFDHLRIWCLDVHVFSPLKNLKKIKPFDFIHTRKRRNITCK